MTLYLSYVKDTIGQNYLAIKVYPDIIQKYLDELKDILGDEYETYVQNQKNRDHDTYHITIINAMDYNKLSKAGVSNFVNSLDKILKYEIDDIKLMGIGTASKNENTTYFVVVQSDKLQAIRKMYNLPEQDFHITLGFLWKDVFGVRKNVVMEKKSKFLQLLSKEYLRKENFEFIKKIGNYSESSDLEIVPISIDENNLKIKVGDQVMNIGLVDDRFWIVSQYRDDEDLQRLPTTDILKVIKL